MIKEVNSIRGDSGYTIREGWRGWANALSEVQLDLTNTADLTAWLTKYNGSYTCGDDWSVADYTGEYIPVQTNVAPYYGGRWTGTEWVDTEPDGVTPLTNTIGLAFHPSTTNVIASGVYRDFTNTAWTKTNGSITTGAVTLIDGTSVSDKNTFTASAANGTIIHDPYVSASGVHSGGVFIKRKTGTGDIEVTIDGGTTWVDVTSQVAGDSGWHLCQTTLPTVTDPEFGVRLATSGDAVYLDWAQLDDGFARVSSHPIKGGVTLPAQSFIAADAADVGKLVKDKQGYVIVECQLLPDDLGLLYGKIVNRNAFVDNTEMLQLVPSTGLKSVDLGGNHLTVSSGAFSGLSKVASYWWDANKQLSMNGSSSPVGTYSGSWGSDLMAIGGKTGTGYQFNGIISKITFGVGIKTTQAKMEEATTPG